jgi:hypothetical protein
MTKFSQEDVQSRHLFGGGAECVTFLVKLKSVLGEEVYCFRLLLFVGFVCYLNQLCSRGYRNLHTRTPWVVLPSCLRICHVENGVGCGKDAGVSGSLYLLPGTQSL